MKERVIEERHKGKKKSNHWFTIDKKKLVNPYFDDKLVLQPM